MGTPVTKHPVATLAAVDKSCEQEPGWRPLCRHAGGISQDRSQRPPRLAVQDCGPHSGNELTIVLPEARDPRREKRPAQDSVNPLLPRRGPDLLAVPLGADSPERIASEHAPGCFP